MNKTVILTYLHTPFWGSEQFYKSTERIGIPVYNAWNLAEYKNTVGCIMTMLYKGLLHLKKEGYTHVIYSDAADTYFLKSFEPGDSLLISAEKACFPDGELAEVYPKTLTPWKYVNAGNWCGPIDFAIEFFERYKLNSHQGKHANGQREWHHAFLQSQKDNLNIHLDYQCLFMQSIAFEDPGDFSILIDRKLQEWPTVVNDYPKIINNITKSQPCVFHGNGRTNMDWIYNLIK